MTLGKQAANRPACAVSNMAGLRLTHQKWETFASRVALRSGAVTADLIVALLVALPPTRRTPAGATNQTIWLLGFRTARSRAASFDAAVQRSAANRRPRRQHLAWPSCRLSVQGRGHGPNCTWPSEHLRLEHSEASVEGAACAEHGAADMALAGYVQRNGGLAIGNEIVPAAGPVPAAEPATAEKR